MTVKVRVIPRARKSKVEAFNNGLKVHLNSPAIEGRANKELVEVLAGHYGVKKYNIKIVKGMRQKDKLVEISEIN